MSTKSKGLFDTFNMLNPVDAKVAEIVEYEKDQINRHKETQMAKIEDDYNLTRHNLTNLLTTAQDALEDAIAIAKESEHPRAFEVVGQLIEKIANINEKLLTLSEKKQKLDSNQTTRSDGASSTSPAVTNNSIFVGSTNELKKMILEMKDK